MMKIKRLAVLATSSVTLSCLLPTPGCTLQEVRSKTRGGPEFRHSGSNRTNSDRWMVEQGVEFKWENGVNTGMVFRRRDVDDGNGDNENLVMCEVSFPLWKAKSKQTELVQRIKLLEERLAKLEQDRADGENQ
ncbi:MAG: hypothetical protein ABII12_16745 [Planctomycetota bacterium]